MIIMDRETGAEPGTPQPGTPLIKCALRVLYDNAPISDGRHARGPRSPTPYNLTTAWGFPKENSSPQNEKEP